MQRPSVRTRSWLLVAVLAAACSPAAEEVTDEGSDLEIECSGKCDGLGSIKSFIKDAKKLDLGDLVVRGGEMATQQVNDTLAFSNGSAHVDAPVLYALHDRAQGDLTLHDIDSLVSGLAARFGEKELTTAVNTARRDHLRSSNDVVFAESAFRLGAGFSHGMGIEASGLGANVTLGFGASGSLEGRVIAAYRDEATAVGGSALEALKSMRGFVFPRKLGDVRQMKPGELVALRGAGALGINMGLGVPLLVADPASFLTYNVALSAALRAGLSGQLDVQLVRLEGNEAILDVGLEGAKVLSASLAVSDGFGTSGIGVGKYKLGKYEVDLATLAQKALQKQLDHRLKLVSAHAEATHRATRLSVARFRFDVSADSDEVAAALAQAMRGDVRLAQALANRGDTRVHAEFDLLRSGVSSVSHAGLDLLGMSFFTTREMQNGEVAVQTPGGARSLLFESLHKESGWFFSTHGYTRVALSGLVFDGQESSSPKGEANLFVQVMGGDDYLEREKLVDGLDGLLTGIAGKQAYRAMETAANELERYVNGQCDEQTPLSSSCYVELLDDPNVISLQDEAMEAYREAVAGRTAAERGLLDKAAKLRVAAQSAVDPKDLMSGPPGSMVVDFRLDDRALGQLFSQDEGLLQAVLEDYVEAVAGNRALSGDDLAAQRQDAVDDVRSSLHAMGAAFSKRAKHYSRALGTESAVIRGLGAIGAHALEIRFPVDAASRPDYERASLESLSHLRAQEAAGLFDDLVDLAREFSDRPEQVAAFALLGLVERESTDLRVDVRLDLDGDSWLRSFEHYRRAGYAPFDAYYSGPKVSPIDGGLFSLDALQNF